MYIWYSSVQDDLNLILRARELQKEKSMTDLLVSKQSPETAPKTQTCLTGE
jgi:hypothetical protein